MMLFQKVERMDWDARNPPAPLEIWKNHFQYLVSGYYASKPLKKLIFGDLTFFRQSGTYDPGRLS